MNQDTKELQILRSTVNKLFGIAIVMAIALCFCFAKVATPPEYRPIMMFDFTRTVGTAYRPSTERDVVVQGSVSIAATLSLTGGQSGTINLQTSPDGITYTTRQHCTNNNLGTLVIGLNTNSVQDTQLGTIVPRGYYYKFVSSGTATMSSIVQLTETHF